MIDLCLKLLRVNTKEIQEIEARTIIYILNVVLRRLAYAYHYEEGSPIQDGEYDNLMAMLVSLESRFPHLQMGYSATQQVGAIQEKMWPPFDFVTLFSAHLEADFGV